MEEKIDKLTDSIKDYLQSEVMSTVEDYKLLEEMNEATAKVIMITYEVSSI